MTDDAITDLLIAAGRGDGAALDALFPLVYDSLRILARRQRRAWQGDLTLNTTALVHEAYLKLVNQERIAATSRAHFFAIAATVMRHVLCNYARDRRRLKRGGDAHHESLDDVAEAAAGLESIVSDEDAIVLSALDDALRRLALNDQRQSRIVECRFFAGLSIDETAEALGISPATVKRDWMLARAWLYREIQLELRSG